MSGDVSYDEYIVAGPKWEGFPGRRVRLTPAQAIDRLGNLTVRDLERGEYEVARPIELKRGEVIGLTEVTKSEQAAKVLTPVALPDKKRKG